MIGKLKRNKTLSEANINRLVENIRSIDSLIGISVISFDISNKQFKLHPLCWANKDDSFKTNYVHSLSQYMIVKNNGVESDFVVSDNEGTAIATYRVGGIVQLS